METEKQCSKCKEQKDVSNFPIIRGKYLSSYCKQCKAKCNLEKYGDYKIYYQYTKSIQPPILCECGKTITKPYYLKYHIKRKIHLNKI